jgi:glycosyltransferase involved in cell wall biosynthesis
VISKTDNLKRLKYLVTKMNLNKNIEFVGYISNPSMFYTNASLHLFPTLAEAFPNILSETLVYGIPNILAGLDYVSTAKGGTVIIYDDSPISIAKIAIKILKNKRYRIKLGKGARNNMKKFRNDLLLRKWIKLLLSIYKGENYYKFLRQKKRKSSEVEYINIINNQLKLLKLRNKQYLNISINNIENFTFMENIEKYLLNHS